MITLRSRRKLLALPKDATLFELLDITPRSAERVTELSLARRAVASLVHPDRDPTPEGADVMARANAAFEVLSSVQSTKQYLAQLRSTHKQCAVCAGEGERKKQVGYKAVFLRCVSCGGMGYSRKAS